ncbi:hypothetical protein B0H14DRAFT_3047809 [Mycena olivaceomarginata]|nr:hypothetical protein B0H14DRAFT_3047809 [Mycena olivaceomarginata]
MLSSLLLLCRAPTRGSCSWRRLAMLPVLTPRPWRSERRRSSSCSGATGTDDWRPSARLLCLAWEPSIPGKTAFGCVVSRSMRLESCESIEARDWVGGA